MIIATCGYVGLHLNVFKFEFLFSSFIKDSLVIQFVITGLVQG